ERCSRAARRSRREARLRCRNRILPVGRRFRIGRCACCCTRGGRLQLLWWRVEFLVADAAIENNLPRVVRLLPPHREKRAVRFTLAVRRAIRPGAGGVAEIRTGCGLRIRRIPLERVLVRLARRGGCDAVHRRGRTNDRVVREEFEEGAANTERLR